MCVIISSDGAWGTFSFVVYVTYSEHTAPPGCAWPGDALQCERDRAGSHYMYHTMVSAGTVASCLALLAPARGFVSPIVSRTPGAEVCTAVWSCHQTNQQQ